MVNNSEKENLEKKISENLKLFAPELGTLSENQMLFALAYPKDALIRFALNLCDENEKRHVRKDVEENLLLAFQLNGIAIILSENDLNSIDDYNNFITKQSMTAKMNLNLFT